MNRCPPFLCLLLICHIYILWPTKNYKKTTHNINRSFKKYSTMTPFVLRPLNHLRKITPHPHPQRKPFNSDKLEENAERAPEEGPLFQDGEPNVWPFIWQLILKLIITFRWKRVNGVQRELMFDSRLTKEFLISSLLFYGQACYLAWPHYKPVCVERPNTEWLALFCDWQLTLNQSHVNKRHGHAPLWKLLWPMAGFLLQVSGCIVHLCLSDASSLNH